MTLFTWESRKDLGSMFLIARSFLQERIVNFLLTLNDEIEQSTLASFLRINAGLQRNNRETRKLLILKAMI